MRQTLVTKHFKFFKQSKSTMWIQATFPMHRVKRAVNVNQLGVVKNEGIKQKTRCKYDVNLYRSVFDYPIDRVPHPAAADVFIYTRQPHRRTVFFLFSPCVCSKQRAPFMPLGEFTCRPGLCHQSARRVRWTAKSGRPNEISCMRLSCARFPPLLPDKCVLGNGSPAVLLGAFWDSTWLKKGFSCARRLLHWLSDSCMSACKIFKLNYLLLVRII
jgi:hypothetical protein